MKKILLIHVVTILYIINAFSQSTADSLLKSPTCFMIAHIPPKSVHKNVSEIFYIGDKVKVKLKGNQLIRGTLVNISRDSIISIDGAEFNLQAIQRIAKTKTSTGTAIVGSLITAAGVVTLATFQVDISSDAVPAQFVVGLSLVAIGVTVLTGNPKFKVESGDQMMFKD